MFTERPLYDASKIKVPVLILRGDADQESLDADARGLFHKLTSALYKRYVLIGDGTHFINGEKNRWQLFQEVHLFFATK
jgi:alpha-beta hydrolase superfamily lysophospholipase